MDAKEIIETINFDFSKDNLNDDEFYTRLFNSKTDYSEIEFHNILVAIKTRAKDYKITSEINEKIKIYQKVYKDNQKKADVLESVNRHKKSYPRWIDEDMKINEVEFVRDFAEMFQTEPKYKCINGDLYTVMGRVEDNQIKGEIQKLIEPWTKRRVASSVENLIKNLKNACYSEPIPIDEDNIYLENGFYNISSKMFFENKYQFTKNRLSAEYKRTDEKPNVWLKYLSELLQEEDIPIAQEYLGYCLIPTKRGQKALFIHGNGGEGKSVLKSVISNIFGKSYTLISIKDVAEGEFSVATLDNKLIAIDDDAQTSAFKETGKFKILITNSDPMLVNPKGRQAYEAVVYSRFIALSNQPIQALHDNTEGFFRRQILLKTKDKPKGRVNDAFLTDKILKEKSLILNWCIEGLHRLISNGYLFTESTNSRNNIHQLMCDSFNVLEFVKDDEYIEFKENCETTSNDLYSCYSLWCSNNGYEPVKQRTLMTYFKTNAEKFEVKATNNIFIDKKRSRGFKGILVRQKWDINI
ncbi:MAG: phage/plasmid primase, P4 family [Clostridia bacterium]